MNDSQIAEIRAFNRFYTRQLGLLNEHVAQSRFSLAEGRVLYEIGQRGNPTAGDLVGALGLDPAYLSRIVQKLLGLELLLLLPNLSDRRSNRIVLSKDGDAAVAELNDLNDRAVEAMLAGVAATDRARLADAMGSIRLILGDTTPRAPLVVRPHRIGDMGWLIHRQALLYNQQFGWDISFEALIAGIYGDFESAPDAPPKALWIAEQAGRIVGSVFVQPFEGSADIAQLRMLYVEPDARGLGLGTLLVKQAVAFGRERGYRKMKLWTHDNLAAARKIYAAEGFAMISATPVHSFGQDVVSEFWELAF